MKKLKEISKEQFLELSSVGATVIYDHACNGDGYRYTYDSYDTLLSIALSDGFGKDDDFRTAQEFLSGLWEGRQHMVFKFFVLVDAE